MSDWPQAHCQGGAVDQYGQIPQRYLQAVGKGQGLGKRQFCNCRKNPNNSGTRSGGTPCAEHPKSCNLSRLRNPSQRSPVPQTFVGKLAQMYKTCWFWVGMRTGGTVAGNGAWGWAPCQNQDCSSSWSTHQSPWHTPNHYLTREQHHFQGSPMRLENTSWFPSANEDTTMTQTCHWLNIRNTHQKDTSVREAVGDDTWTTSDLW